MLAHQTVRIEPRLSDPSQFFYGGPGPSYEEAGPGDRSQLGPPLPVPGAEAVPPPVPPTPIGAPGSQGYAVPGASWVPPAGVPGMAGEPAYGGGAPGYAGDAASAGYGGYGAGGYGGYGGGYSYGGYGPPGWPPVPVAPPQPPVQVIRHTLTRRNWVTVVVAVALISAAVGGLIGATVGIHNQQTIVETFGANRSLLPAMGDIQAILARVEPAVVSIDSQSTSTGGVGGDFVQAAGTGMIITPGGEVLTNNHVIAGAAQVTVTLFGQTQARAAHVIGTDPTHDLALVQIDGASGLPTVTLGDSAASKVGDSVLAIGNALALAGGPSVTEGIVSAENRSLTAQNDAAATETLTGLLQTDAAINPGNSGGPLVNAQAQVIGINTAVASSSAGNAPAQNIGFAIAIDSVKPRLAELRQGGPGGAGNAGAQPVPVNNSAYMGVAVGTVTPAVQQQLQLTPSSGAYVVSVQPGSPADKAGIRANDVIVSFNGSPIASASGLTSAIHPLKPGDHVSVGLYRGPAQLTVDVTLGARPTGG